MPLEATLPLVQTYPVDIVRSFDRRDLATPSEAELERGEAEGLFANHDYFDLRGASWSDVANIVAREAALIVRFEAAADLEEIAEQIDEERADGDAVEDDFLRLDVGVAGATAALSAMGAVPVSSCNAGGFGGFHSAPFPQVIFYIAPAAAPEVLDLATSADVGLDIVADGMGRLFGRTDYDLHRFALTALERSGTGPA